MGLKVLICDPLDPRVTEELKAKYETDEKTDMTPEDLVATIPDYDVAIVRSATKIRQPAIDVAQNLGLIVRAGVGLDNIDVEYARAKGIKVENTPSASSPAVAELAIGHMLTLLRYIHAANVTMRQSEWNKKSYKGREIAGKKVGIIGIGRIGSLTAEKAHLLGAEIIAYDQYVTAPQLDFVKMVDLDTLLKESDIVSLHIPASEQPTIGARELDIMKDDAILVNCARGGVVDEDALLNALKAGKFWGVGIDVWEEEPTHNTALINHPKVSATCHLGANSKESQARVGQAVLDKIAAYK